jgi:nucleotide-binding universal stress UspA family protein
MNNNRILVPVDFSKAAETAIQFAAVIAEKSQLGVTLLNITDEKSTAESEALLKDWTEKLAKEACLGCEFKTRKGNIFKEIPSEAASESYDVVIIGTHGFKGMREKFFGTDILKLVKSISVPVIVLQKDYLLPEEGIKTIVFPAATHKAYANNIKAASYIASLFDSEIHLYTAEKPGQEWSPELKANIELARTEFEKAGVRYKRVNEKQTTFSLGFAKQILKYSTQAKADLIAVMSIPTPENYYFADSDKELLLVNEPGIPILCTTDKVSL